MHTRVHTVEGLYCKRPIQCLASSETPPGECVDLVYPPAVGAGGGHTRWGERGWGVNSSEDARHCSVLYIQYVNTLWCTLSQYELLFASFRPHTSIYLFTQQNIKIMEFVVYIKR
jgi:hypothetical protein